MCVYSLGGEWSDESGRDAEKIKELWSDSLRQESSHVLEKFDQTRLAQRHFLVSIAFSALLIHLQALELTVLDDRLAVVIRTVKTAGLDILFFLLTFIITFMGFVLFAQIWYV